MNALSLSKRPSLTKGQKGLLDLTVHKIENNTKLTFEESKNLYISYGCREKKDGIAYYWDWWDHRDKEGNWKGKLKPMDEYMIRTHTVMWLTHNIGSLVLKGYLKVIPVLELE